MDSREIGDKIMDLLEISKDIPFEHFFTVMGVVMLHWSKLYNVELEDTVTMIHIIADSLKKLEDDDEQTIFFYKP